MAPLSPGAQALWRCSCDGLLLSVLNRDGLLTLRVVTEAGETRWAVRTYGDGARDMRWIIRSAPHGGWSEDEADPLEDAELAGPEPGRELSVDPLPSGVSQKRHTDGG